MVFEWIEISERIAGKNGISSLGNRGRTEILEF